MMFSHLPVSSFWLYSCLIFPVHFFSDIVPTPNMVLNLTSPCIVDDMTMNLCIIDLPNIMSYGEDALIMKNWIGLVIFLPLL